MKHIKRIIEEIGISEMEYEIYTTLLKLGESTVLEISKSSGIPRTTVHQNVDKLLKKGLVSQIVTSSRRKLVAEDPETLYRIFSDRKISVIQKKNELENLDHLFPDIISNLQGIIAQSKKTPGIKLKYYDDIDQIRSLYDEIVQSKEIRTYVNLSQLKNFFPENDVKFYKALERGTHIWDLAIGKTSPNDFYQQNLGKFENYHGHLIEHEESTSYMDYLMYDGKISIVVGDLIPSARYYTK